MISRRKAYLATAVSFIVLGAAAGRFMAARHYMQRQIQRLADEGKGNYSISSHKLMGATRTSGICMVVTAFDPASDHAIEIDYPWLPFLFAASHRI